MLISVFTTETRVLWSEVSRIKKKKREKKDLCKGKKENEDCGEQLKVEGMEKHLFARLC